jgi:hypothetical protein
MSICPHKRKTQQIGSVGVLSHDPTISPQVTYLGATEYWVVGCWGYLCVWVSSPCLLLKEEELLTFGYMGRLFLLGLIQQRCLWRLPLTHTYRARATQPNNLFFERPRPAATPFSNAAMGG